jgi:hypothetical protein
MNSKSIGNSQSFLVTVLSFILSSFLIFSYNTPHSFGVVSKEHNITLTSISENPKMIINTTSLSDCLSYYYFDTKHSSSDSLILRDDLKRNQTIKSGGPANTMCKIINISEINSCFKYFTNQSAATCNLKDSQITDLDIDNFNSNGLLIVDTKFNNSYNFEFVDPSNSSQIIGVNLDLDNHTQPNIDDLNSSRIEIVRKNYSGIPNMLAAKNQEIIWEGNIKDYFQTPVNAYQNETYIAIQFNTGRHGSNIPAEERGFGVLFDVSSSSNPYLFEYRDHGVYTKYDHNAIKQLAGDDFIFHNLDNNNDPIFINNLTNSNKVKLKVLTSSSESDNATRIVETFIGTCSGIDKPYWSLYDLSKLRDHDRITDVEGFMEAINQGSGYTIARTDNIDTRLSAFHSFVFGF